MTLYAPTPVDAGLMVTDSEVPGAPLAELPTAAPLVPLALRLKM